MRLRIKTITAWLLAALLLVTMAACGASSGGSAGLGNTAANILSGGFVASEYGAVYFSADYWENGAIYKMNSDGSNLTKLESGKYWSLNVYEGWLYYLSAYDSYKARLFKMRLDGKEHTELELAGNVVDQFFLANGWIYYSAFESDTSEGGMYRMRTDGTKREQIADNKTVLAAVEQDRLYYLSWSGDYENMRLCSMKPDGTGEKEIFSDEFSYYGIVPDGDWIYLWGSKDGEEGLYKIRRDGTNLTVLRKGYCSSFNLADDWIYYFVRGYSSDEEGGIYRMRTDGSTPTMLFAGHCFNIHIVNDWLYFVDEDDSLCRMRTDGTDYHALP